MNIITNFGNKRFEGSADELKKRIRQERKIYLVDWVDGYGEVPKEKLSLYTLINSDDWGLDDEFIAQLHFLKDDATLTYSDPSGTLTFTKQKEVI